MRKSFLFVALAALALVGCNDKTQSELTEDILGLNGEAKISVQFYYNEGTKLVDGVEVTETLPVPATCKVIAKVDYSQYTGGKKGESFKQFEGAAKGNGVYEFVIPAGEKAIAVEVVANGFKAKYYVNPEKAIEAYYPSVTVPINGGNGVLAGQEFVENDPDNTTFSVDKNIVDNGRNTVIKSISGKLTGFVEDWNKDGYAESVEAGLAEQKIELEVKVLEGENTKDERVLSFFTTTAKDGSFEFKDVAIYDDWKNLLEKYPDTIKMTLKVQKWADDDFKHYFKELDNKFDVDNVWADQNDYDKTFTGLTDRWNKDFLNWSAKLATVIDVDDYMYDWSNKPQSILGSWEVADKKINNVDAIVLLFGVAQNQNLSASFTPQNYADVYGCIGYGKKESVECADNTKVDVPQYIAGNALGWDPYK